jgi:hypothetical protein
MGASGQRTLGAASPWSTAPKLPRGRPHQRPSGTSVVIIPVSRLGWERQLKFKQVVSEPEVARGILHEHGIPTREPAEPLESIRVRGQL